MKTHRSRTLLLQPCKSTAHVMAYKHKMVHAIHYVRFPVHFVIRCTAAALTSILPKRPTCLSASGASRWYQSVLTHTEESGGKQKNSLAPNPHSPQLMLFGTTPKIPLQTLASTNPMHIGMGAQDSQEFLNKGC